MNEAFDEKITTSYKEDYENLQNERKQCGIDTQEDDSGVDGRLINQVQNTPTSVEVRERLFQFQNQKGYFGEIFAVADRKHALEICNTYIKENVKKTEDYITILEKKPEENKKIIKALKSAIEEIKKTKLWELKPKDSKIYKIKVGD